MREKKFRKKDMFTKKLLQLHTVIKKKLIMIQIKKTVLKSFML